MTNKAIWLALLLGACASNRSSEPPSATPANEPEVKTSGPDVIAAGREPKPVDEALPKLTGDGPWGREAEQGKQPGPLVEDKSDKVVADRSDNSASGADNTERNERDRHGDTLTSGDQSNKQTDLDLTQQIRKSVVADDNLSFAAKNIKIIAIDGKVTLRGPVKSASERATIERYARNAPGAKSINNQIEIDK